RGTVAVGLLVEGVDAIADAMRQQCEATRIVKRGEPVPQGLVVLRNVTFPRLVPFGDRLGGRAVLEVGGLDVEGDVPDGDFQAPAGRRRPLEGVDDELV